MLVRKNATANFAANEAGGKGYNLYLMAQMGLPVPAWVVLGRSHFLEFIRSSGCELAVAEALRSFGLGQVTAAAASFAIEQLILAAQVPRELLAEATKGYAEVAASGSISVRSSASDEDGAGHSFAGQLSSFLYVMNIEQALLAIKKCWASAYSERALAYRLERGIRMDGISVAVVLQQMIEPSSAGVLFTCEPTQMRLDQYVVSAVYGVGEGLVSGALDCDTFWLDAGDGAVLKQDVVSKTEAFCGDPAGGYRRVTVAAAAANAPVLSTHQLKELYRLGRRLHEYYGRPQDIEWAMVGDHLYVLQTRAVTSMSQNLTGYPNLWDNSNIVESYGGLTSPLSFSFALRNYKGVYVQFCEILGLPRQVVKDMESYLGNMLGCINGRVFYNLYNWYKLVGVLPGFGNNREFMETMMGVGEQLGGEIKQRIRPHPSWDTWLGKLRKARTGLAFVYYHFTIQSSVARFLRDFKHHYDRFRALPLMRMSSDELFATYLEVERVLLSRWQAPIVNDFLCMVHFGILKKLSGLWLSNLTPGIQNDLLAGEGNLESAEPTKQLISLAGDAVVDPGLKRLLEDTAPQLLLEALNQSQYQDFYHKIVAYIDRFGFRCMSEMKLEEIDLTSDPSFLFVCLKNYLRSGTTDLHAYEQREGGLRLRAESAVSKELSLGRKLIFYWSLKHARRAVKNRENTRFSRTRAYGIARNLFRAMGRDLSERGALLNAEDIFYLTVEEIYGIHQGTLPAYDLNALADVRKEAYKRFAGQEPKIRFLTRGPVYWQNELLAQDDVADVEDGADYHLKGLPCCPGIVEGLVKVVQSPSDDLNLNGEILVTKRTDPGWVPLYPSVSGLLVERGSLLSHSAIVAREMGLPTIVGIKALTATLHTGMRVRLDGTKGTITIIDK